MFSHYIAEAQRQPFLVVLSISLLAFLWMDPPYLKQEVFFVVYCLKDVATQLIGCCTPILAVLSPESRLNPEAEDSDILGEG